MAEDPAATDATVNEAVGYGVEEGDELFVGGGEGEDVGYGQVLIGQSHDVEDVGVLVSS